jgi:hypothetical protein
MTDTIQGTATSKIALAAGTHTIDINTTGDGSSSANGIQTPSANIRLSSATRIAGNTFISDEFIIVTGIDAEKQTGIYARFA